MARITSLKRVHAVMVTVRSTVVYLNDDETLLKFAKAMFHYEAGHVIGARHGSVSMRVMGVL